MKARRITTALPVAVLALSVLVGTAIAAPPDAEPATVPLGPCSFGAAVPGETVPMTLRVDGVKRSYSLHLPSDYDCTPRPLLVGLHGYYGNGSGFERSTALDDRLETAGWIGLFPDGAPLGKTGWKAKVSSFNDIWSHYSRGPDGRTCTADSYNYGVADDAPAWEKNDACNWGTSRADDVSFIRAAVNQAKADFTVDPVRVFLTGFSQGGQTAQSLAKPLADVFTAVSPHHGFATNGYTDPPTTKMSLFQVWGRRDFIVDGRRRPSRDGMIYDGAKETVREWAKAQGCDSPPVPFPTVFDPTPTDDNRHWEAVEYPNCTTGATVVTASWDGPHFWGGINTEFETESMLTFFEQVTAP